MTRRVLHCIPTLLGGGAEHQLTLLASALPAYGWEVHVAFVSAGPHREPLIATGAVLHQLVSRNNHDPMLVWRMHQMLQRVKPALVQTWLTQMDVLAGTLALVRRTPLVLSERSSSAAYPPSAKNRLRLRLGRCAGAVVANSEGGRAYWIERQLDPTKSHVIPNAVPINEIGAAAPIERSSLGIKTDATLILHVGRLHVEKNLFVLMRAFHRVAAASNAMLLLCGDGPDRSALERHVQASGLEGRVVFLGFVTPVWGLLKSADVFVSIAPFEGLPNSVLEAIACECPMVLSNIPAHRAIVSEPNAYLVDAADDASVASGLAAALAAPEERRRRASRARAEARLLAPAEVAREYDAVYRGVMDVRH